MPRVRAVASAIWQTILLEIKIVFTILKNSRIEAAESQLTVNDDDLRLCDSRFRRAGWEARVTLTFLRILTKLGVTFCQHWVR